MENEQKQKRTRKSKILIFAFIATFLVSIGVLVCIEVWWKDVKYIDIAKIIFSNLASIFGISALWEIFGNINLMKEFSKELRRAENINKSGIIDYYNSFYGDIDWNKELQNVKELTIVLIYGEKLFYAKAKELTNFAKNVKNKLTIIFPDWTNETVIKNLTEKYSSSPKEVIEHIKSSAGAFLSIKAKIKCYNKVPSFSYYYFGDSFIVSPYFNESTDKSQPIPAFKLNDNTFVDKSFYDGCKNDLEKIISASRDIIQDEANNCLQKFKNKLE